MPSQPWFHRWTWRARNRKGCAFQLLVYPAFLFGFLIAIGSTEGEVQAVVACAAGITAMALSAFVFWKSL